MSHKTPFSKLLFFTVFLCIFFAAQQLSAQDSTRYEGRIQIGSFLGDATFTYQTQNSDTILQGSFFMEGTLLKDFSVKRVNSFLLDGYFKDNVPTKRWTLAYGEYQATDQSKIRSSELQIQLFGTKYTATGEFDEGLRKGAWTHQMIQVNDSTEEQVLFNSTINYEQGIPLDTFALENDSLKFIGILDDVGIANQPWVIQSTKEENDYFEVWEFEKGWLKSIKVAPIDRDTAQITGLQTDSTFLVLPLQLDTLTLPVYDSLSKNFKNLAVGEKFFNTVSLQQNMLRKSILPNTLQAPQLIRQKEKIFSKIDTLWSNFGDYQFNSKIRARVLFFPLNANEKKELAYVQKELTNLKLQLEKLKNNAQLRIIQRSDVEVKYQMTVVSAFRSKVLQPFEKLIEFREQDMLEYLPREVLMDSLMVGQPTTPRFEVTFFHEEDSITREFIAPNMNDFNQNLSGLKLSEEWLKFSVSSIDSIQSLLNKKLQLKQRKDELLALEDSLLNRFNDFNLKLDSLKENTSSSYQETLAQIQQSLDVKMNAYAADDDMDAKLNDVNDLMECISAHGILADTIYTLPNQLQEIDKVYTDTIWNPFTATFMEEKSKKRITNAYVSVVIPYYLEQIQEKLSCENVEDFIDMATHIRERMYALKEEETYEIERLLRRAQEREQIIELLQINMKP